MADFANPINPQFVQAPAYAVAAPSLKRQRDGTVLDEAVAQSSAVNPGRARPDEELLNRALERLEPRPAGQDPLKALQERQRPGYVTTNSENLEQASQNTADKIRQADQEQTERLKDRARLYSDDNKTLNTDDITLSKPTAQELSAEGNALDIAPKRPDQLATSKQVQQDTQTKRDLPPPQAYTEPESRPAVAVKPAIREKFEALRPVLLDAQNSSDPKDPDRGIISARFVRNEIQKQVALDAQAATNEITSARLDRAQRESASIRTLQTDDRSVAQNPEIATNPRVSFSEDLEKSDTTALERIDPGLQADIRRNDIVGQQYDENQRGLQRNGTGVDSIQSRIADVIPDAEQNNFDRYETRFAERQTGVSENPARSRLERINPESAAVAADQAAARTQNPVLETPETQLEGIKKTNVAADYNYPPDVTPDKLYEREQQARLEGGDALNAPDRQVRQPIEKLERENREQITTKTIEASAESIQIQKLSETVIKADTTIESTVQVRDPVLENQVLASRKDEVGIKAQGQVAETRRKATLAARDQEFVINKKEREQANLDDQREVAKEITVQNNKDQERAALESIRNRDARTESINLSIAQREAKDAHLATGEAMKVSDRYDERIDQRNLSSDDAKFRQNTALVLDAVAKDSRVQAHQDIAGVQANKAEFTEALEYENRLVLEDEALREDYVINIAAPAIREVKREIDAEAAADFAQERIEIAAPPASAAITVFAAETPDSRDRTEEENSEAAIDSVVAPQIIENQNVANKDNGATANLGDSAARAGLDRVAGVG